MKVWMRRSLIGAFGAAALVGGMAAYANRGHGHGYGPWGHGRMTDEDRARWHQHAIDWATKRLDLDATQKARLQALAETLSAQRKNVVGTADPRAEMQALVSGERFDRDRALALVQAKAAAVTEASPAVVTAMADFYDSLRPEQQQQVRDLMARRGGHHGWGR